MAIYQCFFFSGDRIEYWENIESTVKNPGGGEIHTVWA